MLSQHPEWTKALLCVCTCWHLRIPEEGEITGGHSWSGKATLKRWHLISSGARSSVLPEVLKKPENQVEGCRIGVVSIRMGKYCRLLSREII